MNRDRLSASDMLQVRKVVEHVYEKVMGVDSSVTNSSSNGGKNGCSEDTEQETDYSSISEEKVELVCQDQVRS